MKLATVGYLICIAVCSGSTGLFAAGWLYFDGNSPIASVTFADGTCYLFAADRRSVTFARQAVSPRTVGPLSADVGVLGEIQVSRNGVPAGGFRASGNPVGWLPQFRSEVSGYFDKGPRGYSLSAYNRSATFRVSSVRLTVSNLFLIAVAVAASLPVFWTGIRRRRQHRGFEPLPVTTV